MSGYEPAIRGLAGLASSAYVRVGAGHGHFGRLLVRRRSGPSVVLWIAPLGVNEVPGRSLDHDGAAEAAFHAQGTCNYEDRRVVVAVVVPSRRHMSFDTYQSRPHAVHSDRLLSDHA